MRGALVFLAVFALGVIITLGAPTLPPGRAIYDMLGVPPVTYPTLGIPTVTLVSGVFNGVVYGVIAWLAYSAIERAMKKEPKPEEKKPESEEKKDQPPKASPP